MIDRHWSRSSALIWVISAIPLCVMSNAAYLYLAIGLYNSSASGGSGIPIGIWLPTLGLYASISIFGLLVPWFRERFTWGASCYLVSCLCPTLPFSVFRFCQEIMSWLPLKKGGRTDVSDFFETLFIGQVNILLCLAIGHIVVRLLGRSNPRKIDRKHEMKGTKSGP